MSVFKKGNYSLRIIDTTGQFFITGDGHVSQKALSGNDSNDAKAAQDIIDLLTAYLTLRKRNTGHAPKPTEPEDTEK